MEKDILLNVDHLSMAFGGIQALLDVSFEVRKGEIFAIVGPNGSGKSTVLNCITGLYKPTRGEIVFKGKNITGLQPHKVASLELGRTFQNLELFPQMKVIDNVMVGLHWRINIVNSLKLILQGRFRDAWEWPKDEAFKTLDLLGIASFHNKIVRNLPYGILKLIELARALVSGPTLLLLDEPSAGMNDQEAYEMLKIIREIRNFMGITIILVEHDMELVRVVSDKISVLNDGIVIARGDPKIVMKDPQVIEIFLGKGDKN